MTFLCKMYSVRPSFRRIIHVFDFHLSLGWFGEKMLWPNGVTYTVSRLVESWIWESDQRRVGKTCTGMGDIPRQDTLWGEETLMMPHTASVRRPQNPEHFSEMMTLSYYANGYNGTGSDRFCFLCRLITVCDVYYNNKTTSMFTKTIIISFKYKRTKVLQLEKSRRWHNYFLLGGGVLSMFRRH